MSLCVFCVALNQPCTAISAFLAGLHNLQWLFRSGQNWVVVMVGCLLLKLWLGYGKSRLECLMYVSVLTNIKINKSWHTKDVVIRCASAVCCVFVCTSHLVLCRHVWMFPCIFVRLVSLCKLWLSTRFGWCANVDCAYPSHSSHLECICLSVLSLCTAVIYI